MALGFLAGHAAPGFTVYTGVVTWDLRKEPNFYVPLILEARILSPKNFWVILFEGML